MTVKELIQESKATPRPWIADDAHSGRVWHISPDNEDFEPKIAEVYSQANARLIVRAVNSFDALVEALEKAEYSERWEDADGAHCRCPVCACGPVLGHREDCAIAAALRLAREGETENPRKVVSL